MFSCPRSHLLKNEGSIYIIYILTCTSKSIKTSRVVINKTSLQTSSCEVVDPSGLVGWEMGTLLIYDSVASHEYLIVLGAKEFGDQLQASGSLSCFLNHD